jgi:hypothetical protein
MRVLTELMQSYEYSLLLENPQRAAWLMNNVGPKLAAKYRTDLASGDVPPAIQSKIMTQAQLDDFVKKNVAEAGVNHAIAKNLIDYIMAADPTPNKAYSQWLTMRYLKTSHNAANPEQPHPSAPLEDIDEHLKSTLEVFARAAASRRISGDINQYKTIGDLTTAVEPFLTGEREVSGKQDRKAKRNTKVDTKVAKQWEGDPMLKQAKVVYDSDNYMIVQPQTAEAAKHFGANTSWCTTNSMFDSYFARGQLWIILRRKDARRWQFSFDEKGGYRRPEFRTEQDIAIDLNEWMDENPEAVKAIGLKRFANLIGLRSHGFKQPLSLRHFSKKFRDSLPPETLVKTISSMKDIDALPKDKVDTKEFLEGLLKHFSNRIGISHGDGEFNQKDLQKVIAHYTKLFPDQHFWYEQVDQNRWLLKLLPEKYQTDTIKKQLSLHWGTKYTDIDTYIPKPWPEEVEQKYWDERIKEDKRLAASSVPEKYRSENVIVRALARNPYDLEHWEGKIDDTIAAKIVERAIVEAKEDTWKDNYDYRNVERVIDYMPKDLLTQKVQLPIYRKAMDLKAQKDEDKRDCLLRCLAKFPHSMWPWKASTLSHRMSLIHDKFKDLPPELHYNHHAESWVRHHPFELHQLPPEMVSERVVKAALEGAVTPPMKRQENRYGEPTHKKEAGKPYEVYTLNEKVKRCLEEFGGEEGDEQMMDLPVDVVEKAILDVPLALKGWRGIPKKFLTPKIVQAAVAKGFVPFGNEEYPVELYTPDHIVTYFKANVPKQIDHIEKDRGYNINRGKIDNIGGMKDAWNAIPDVMQTPEAGAALLKAGYSAFVRVMPEDWLSEPEILSAFVEGAERYGYASKGASPSDLFKLFKPEAYTTANMAAAVKKGIIDKAPDHLQDDEVLLSLMKQHSGKKTVDWAKITPELFIKFIDRHPYDAAGLLSYGTVTPKTHPLYSDPNVAMAFLSHKPKKNDHGYVGYGDKVEDSQLHDIYGSIKARREKWTEAHYALAAGNIVSLKDIPEKFRSKRVIMRALKTNPDDIAYVKHPIGFLGDNAGKALNGAISIRMLSKGIVNAKNGWVNAAALTHKKVPGAKGSYVMVNLHPGKAMVLFDEEGKPLDALVTHDAVETDKSGYSYRPRDANMWASSYGPAAKDTWNNTHRSDNNNSTDWKSYRVLLGRALEANPDFCKKLPYEHKGVGGLEGLQIYATGREAGEGKTVALIEDMERKTIDGSDLTFVSPDENSYRYGGKRFFFFDGQSKTITALINLSSKGGWRGDNQAQTLFEGISLGHAPMHRLLELAAGFTAFLRDHGVVSGQNPKFKESILHDKLGIRGPGKGEWWCYLAEKVSKVGDLTVWRNHERLAITDDEHGVIATAKNTKSAGIKIDSVRDGIGERAQQVFDAVKGKL